MNPIEPSYVENKPSFKFAVVAQSAANESNLTNPLAGTESGRRFNMWLEAAGLLGIPYYATNAVKRVIRPGVQLSALEQYEGVDQLNDELQPFKVIITLGKVAANAVASLEFKDKLIINLPHPSGLNRQNNSPDVLKSTIEALRAIKNKI